MHSLGDGCARWGCCLIYCDLVCTLEFEGFFVSFDLERSLNVA